MIIRAILGALLASAGAFGGQSIILNGALVSNDAFPNRSKALPWRVEFYLHDWNPTQQIVHVVNAGGIGFQADIYNLPGSLYLQAFSWWDLGGSGCLIGLGGVSPKGIYVRFQRDPVAKVSSCEAWDSNGIRIQNSNLPYTSDRDSYNFSGVAIGDLYQSGPISIGFFRIHTTLVPVNSRPPVTYDPSDALLWWKLDGDLKDASSNGYDAYVYSGMIGYAPTPVLITVAKPKTFGAPAWSDWVSLRAGVPQRLDGSASYSQADASSSVKPLWQQISGPTTVLWDDPTSITPTVRGLVFGTYVFRLKVSDASGQTATSDLTVGAVATDANGVVIQANPDADKIFGPMIAFGRNPWGYADERALRATTLRSAAYDAAGLASPSWSIARAGLVNYDLAAKSTTLVGAITATDTAITVSDASQLELTTFPTLILLGNAPFEEIHICSASGNVLGVCYDGRAWRAGSAYHMVAQAWPTGTNIFQAKITGSGTQFLTDFCPAGSGWSGLISYQTGSVNVVPGSSSVAGAGTSWANTNAGGRAIRIAGTHGGGIPFVFHAYVSSVGNPTLITMSRPWPADADPGSFSYALLNADTRNITPHYNRADGSDGEIYFLTSGCESDTDLYRYQGWEGLRGPQTGKPYSWIDGFGYVGDFGPNFYDEVLANYALYFRSGWTPARDAARKLGDGWLQYPEIAQGDAGGIPRRMSITGTVAAAVLDGRVRNWSALRSLANRGVAAIADSCDQDVRENAYELSWLALAALFDPLDTGNPADPNQRSYWKAKLAGAYQRDSACRGSDDSWKSGFYWNPYAYPPLTTTNGSATVTGTNLPAAMCPAVSSGLAIAATNLATITGAGFQDGNKILITGTMAGKPYTGAFEFRLDNPAQITLSVLWPGDTGPVSWMIEGGESRRTFATIATDNVSDSRFGQIWACRWDNASQITLDRPWAGNGTETVYMWRDNLVGRGQQPFILGIKTLQMKYASLVDDPALAAGYGSLAAAAGNWILNQGFDPKLKAVGYGRIFPQCEPPMAESGIATLDFRIPECIENSYNPDAVSVARARNAEAQNAVRVAYEANPTQESKNLGDQFYCAQWGDLTLTQKGFCADGITASNLTDGSLGAYKWTGFFFGIGMAHQWPAVRLGGVPPFIPKTIGVNFDLGGVPLAVEVRITITQPSGAQTEYRCSISPCQVTVDPRQGAHWIWLQYLSQSGSVLSAQEPYLVDPN